MIVMFVVSVSIIAIIPGAIIALCLDRLPLGWIWLVPLSAGMSVLVSFLISLFALNPSKLIARTLHEHVLAVVLIAPFFFLATLLPLYLLRKVKRPQNRAGQS